MQDRLFRALQSSVASCLALWAWIAPATVLGQSAGLQLDIRPRDTNGWLRVRSPGASNRVHVLQASAAWPAWTNIATLHDGPFEFADPASPEQSSRFYRTVTRSKTAADDGKNLVNFPEELFQSRRTPAFEETRWVKFAILLSDPTRVWFQDSAKYPFHYDYAVNRLEPFLSLSRMQFDALSLRTNNQQAVLGAVLYPPAWASDEFGIQFVGLDPYPPEQVAAWFRLVNSAVFRQTPALALYVPAFEQTAAAENARSYFQNHGITIGHSGRWLSGDALYANGWALGRLVFVPASQIDSAYTDGRLRPTDILLTDGVPAELPFLAGIVSLVPATPNSHVAILARSYGIPFVYVSDAAERDRLTSLSGRELLLRVNSSAQGEVKTAAVDAGLDPAYRAAILALKAPGKIDFTPKAVFGALATNVDRLAPSDFKYFGGKAANYGLLRRTIPSNTPPAIAMSFDLWDAFMNQSLPAFGRTLREEIRARTATFTYPPNVAAVRVTLAEIRDLIRDTARFTPEQQQAILFALSPFGTNANVRFRSSTNVEDSEQFTGAGLYDSFSGCPADDLDGDTRGPSRCDPSERNERGVFRALQRVYASFYNDNAWMERLRFGLNEDALGMAVLAHHSFPDELEMANGVATLTFTRSGASRNYVANLVTQFGAVSITNPEGGAKAEVVSANRFGTFVGVSTREYSNLVPLGGNVMEWQKDYISLLALLVRVTDGYAAMFPGKTSFILDFEYKKMRPGDLVVKQVREVPPVPAAPSIAPFLLNEPTVFGVFQGERGDVFTFHRLKCRLTLNARNLQLNATNLASSFYTNTVLEFVDDAQLVRLTNGPSGWPQATYFFDGKTATNRWSWGSGEDARQFALETSSILTSPIPRLGPLITPRDFSLRLQAGYARGVPITGFPTLTNTRSESVPLTRISMPNARSLLQNRVLTNRSGVKVESSFYWPEPPSGPSAGYTAPLLEWVETRITGLTKQPIVLRGFYSQTYHPGHHNFWEDYIFEPRLEPGIGTAQLEELRQADVRLVLVVTTRGQSADSVAALGFDGRLRSLP